MTEPATQPPTTPPPEPDALPDLIAEGGRERGMIARAGLLVAALVMFALAILLWITPVLTGIPFWILGFVMLGMVSRRTARWVNRQESRLPRRVRLLLRPGYRRKLKERG